MSGAAADEDAGAGFRAAWDGMRRFALHGADARAAFALFSHTAAAQELTAVWEAEAGACVVTLPEGCRHIELQVLRGGSPAETIAFELDDLLLPEFVAADLPGLLTIDCAIENGALALSDGDEPPKAGAMRCLNLVAAGYDGEASFSRRRVGPLFDPAGPGRRMVVRAESTPEGAVLRLGGSGGGQALAAHVFGPMVEGLAAGAFGGEDASGASAEACIRRGFRMLAFAGGEDGTAALDLAPFATGDEAIVFAPRGYVLTWDGDPGRPGSRLFLSRDEGGAWRARAVTAAYKPATATAMAALGVGGALALYEGGATATASEADRAADLAAAIWRRRPAATPTGPTRLEVAPAPAVDLPPLARLTLQGAEAPAGLSPVVAALGPAFGAAAQALEEVDALPAREKLALVLWFAQHPPLALRALRRRLILPPPAGAPPAERVAAVLDWCEEPDLRDRLEHAAGRVDGGSADGRDKQRLLRRAAEGLDEGWFAFDEAAAAETVMRHLPRVAGEAEDSPAGRLLARLRADAGAVAAAMAESRKLDLAQLAEWRSGLAAAAAQAGQPAALIGDIGRRLPELSAADILLIHRHLRAAAQRLSALGAIRRATEALDAAAGNGGLAGRMDRGGDALGGMTRLGGASETAVRALTRVPAARDALVALTRFIDRHAAADAGDALVIELRRNLQSYGCLLLAQAIARECAEALAAGRPDAPEHAWRERLRSGVVEMLPAYVRAAASVLPEDAALGASFTDRLPAAS